MCSEFGVQSGREGGVFRCWKNIELLVIGSEVDSGWLTERLLKFMPSWNKRVVTIESASYTDFDDKPQFTSIAVQELACFLSDSLLYTDCVR